MLNNGLPATTSLELCESPTNVTWSCSQKNPGLQASYCPGGAYAQNPALTSGAGQLTDRWSLFSSAYSPAGCGVNDTDPWYYMQSGTNTSYLGTLTGYVHTDAVSINGVACTGSEQTGCGMATGTVIH
jgi:hypothetical protein